MSVNPSDMAAVEGRVVTEGHTRYCEAHGHATHTIDGVAQDRCPRCGELKADTDAQQEVAE